MSSGLRERMRLKRMFLFGLFVYVDAYSRQRAYLEQKSILSS